MRYLICAIACLFSLFVSTHSFAAMNDAAAKTDWGYKGNIGPARWGVLSTAFAGCAAGKEQSPINIKSKITPAPYDLRVGYRRAPLEIMRDGLTELTIENDQALVNTGHGIQVDFHHQDREYIHLEGNKYELVQFHMHTPSENQLQNETFPMEIHFVNQGSHGEIAVLGVFVKASSEENATLAKIIEYLPAKDGKEHIIPQQYINPAKLLPNSYSYYRFAGSLTTPPCIEGLQWVVFAEPITASSGQIAALRKAMGGANARPVQPLHDREVTYSKQSLVARAMSMVSWLY